MPRLSIGLPVHNGQRYLGDAIRSILVQSHTDLELLVCDNASTDRSLEIARRYATLDSRVRVLTSPTNRGAAWNFNRAVAEASGELFKWASHDDVLSDHFLHHTIALLDKRSDAVVAHCETLRLDASSRIAGTYERQPSFDEPRASDRFRSVIRTPHRCLAVFGVMRLDALRATPMIGAYTGSDRNLLAELALRGPILHVERALFARRDHPDASIRKHRDERARAEWFDPTLRGAAIRPTWRRWLEYASGVERAPISAFERARCHRHLTGWLLGAHQDGP
ncbi:MAG: glycosyltransferase family 2 protein, partial [Planctomycetota bacterium]